MQIDQESSPSDDLASKGIFDTVLDCWEIKPVNPKGSQPWIFIGRTDAEAEAPLPENFINEFDKVADYKI